ncbi:unnamed protein product, partial [Owenia fusiformis]
IQGANQRNPASSCGLIGANDCNDAEHTFDFYRFVGLDASRFDESATVPDFESTCYDKNLVQNKYIHLKYECIAADAIARLGENKTISSFHEIQILNKAYPHITLSNVDNHICNIYGPTDSTTIVTLIRSRVINGDKNIVIRDSRMERCSVIPLQTFESNFGKEIYRGVYPITLYLNSSQTALSMMWLSIKDANGGRISAECYNVGHITPPRLPEVCLPPVTTPSPIVASTSLSPSQNLSANTFTYTSGDTTAVYATTEVGITSAQESETYGNGAQKEVSGMKTQYDITTESMTNVTDRDTLSEEQFNLEEGVIIGIVVAVFVVALVILILTIFFVRRRLGKSREGPNDNDAELEATYANIHEGHQHTITTAIDTTQESGDLNRAGRINYEYVNPKCDNRKCANTAYDHQEYANTTFYHRECADKAVQDQEYANTAYDHEEYTNIKYDKPEYANIACEKHTYVDTEEPYARLAPEGMHVSNDYERLATQPVKHDEQSSEPKAKYENVNINTRQ